MNAGRRLVTAAFLAGFLLSPVSAQDSERVRQAEAAMLRRTLQRRDERIEQLEAKVAELRRRIEQLQSDLEQLSSRQTRTAPAENDNGTSDVENGANGEEAQNRLEELVPATRPADADYYGLSRLLRAIPESRMSGDEATEEGRKQFDRWAKEHFAGKQLYCTFDVQQANRGDNGGWILLGEPPRQVEYGRRKFFITVLAEVSDEQYSSIEPEVGDRAKLIGRLYAERPVETVNARINETREERLYGKVVSRRLDEVDIEGWNRDYAALVVRLRGVRLLK